MAAPKGPAQHPSCLVLAMICETKASPSIANARKVPPTDTWTSENGSRMQIQHYNFFGSIHQFLELERLLCDG